MKILLLILSFSVFITSCGSKKVNVNGKSYDVKGTAQLYAGFLKDKKSKYDLEINGTSISKTPIVIQKGDLACGKGETQGKIIKIGRVKAPYIVLNVGKFTNFYIVCKLDTKVEGKYYLQINKLYKTANKDSIVPTEVQTTDVKWTVN
jgi:hypothetical protein